MSKGAYSYNTKEWQPLIGCHNDLPCLGRCWAHPAVRRTVKCLEKDHPERAEFFKQFVTPTGWTGKVALDEAHLLDPLKWRKGEIVAAGYHGDIGLLAPEDLDRIFAVAALCPQHTFLFLSKRPERLVEYFTAGRFNSDARVRIYNRVVSKNPSADTGFSWPLPNVYLGTSASNQPEYDERARHLSKLAAAGWRPTWLSLEPMIEALNLRLATPCDRKCNEFDYAECPGTSGPCVMQHRFDWVVLGGESGKDARPFNLSWARAVRDQCAAAEVPFYMKQMGARPTYSGATATHPWKLSDHGDQWPWKPWGWPLTIGWWSDTAKNIGGPILKSRSGSDPAEWPADLRVQQTPWEAPRAL